MSWKNSSFESHLAVWHPAHTKSGHLDKETKLGFPPQVPALLFQGTFYNNPSELSLQKVSDLHFSHLVNKGICNPALFSPACSWPQREDRLCPRSSHTSSLPLMGSVSNKSCIFTFCVWVYWSSAFDQNDPWSFHLPKVGSQMLRELLSSPMQVACPPSFSRS